MNFSADVKQGFRTLVRKPAYAAVALLTLSLGIAANALIFSIVNGVLLRPLDYPNADRVMTLLHANDSPASPADFLDWKKEARSFEMMEAAVASRAAISGTDGAETISGLMVTPGMFDLLGTKPALGRPFVREDGRPGQNVVVLSHGLWQRRFGGDPRVIGTTIHMNGEPTTVVGVMPPSFRFTPFWVTNAEMWRPWPIEGPVGSRQIRMMRVFGLRRAGVSEMQARSEMTGIVANLAAAYPETNAGLTIKVEPLTEKVVGKVRTPLLVLLGAVGLVMLIACSNIASLTLARALERRREVGIRIALGAGRLRIARQLLTESVVLAVLGGAAGLVIAQWGLRAMKYFAFAGNLPRFDQVQIDNGALVFTALLALVSGVVSGFMPALQASRFDVNETLKDSTRGSSAGSHSGRLRSALVVAEVAICMVLLAGAGVLLRSYLSLRNIDPGFDPRNVLTMTVSITNRQEYRGDARDALYRRILSDVRNAPGVEAAAMVNHLPIGGDTWGFQAHAEGTELPKPGSEIGAVFRVSMPGYFDLMRMKLAQGRDFTEFDGPNSQPVTIVNEALAKRLWPGQNPIGKRVTVSDPRRNPQWMTVVGVLRNVRQAQWTSEPGNEIYLPYLQTDQARMSTEGARAYMTLVVRTAGDPMAAAEPVRRAVATIDAGIPVASISSMEHIISGALAQARFSMILTGLFAIYAVLLACVGIYGVMSYLARSREREIGIRIALGASRSEVVRMILKQGLTLTGGGMTIGLLSAFALTGTLRTLVYGVSPADPVTFIVAPAALMAVALAAVFGPAWRASTSDPGLLLRSDG